MPYREVRKNEFLRNGDEYREASAWQKWCGSNDRHRPMPGFEYRRKVSKSNPNVHDVFLKHWEILQEVDSILPREGEAARRARAHAWFSAGWKAAKGKRKL